MSRQQSLTSKSIQSLMVSGLIMTGLCSFNTSAAISQEVKNTHEVTTTQTQEKTNKPIQESTQPNWCSRYRPC
ncbi:hypothetical protein [Chroococcus sp. FPU101]|uniref:hypothetical protein n=1 Tax=Chroococcus sp. FPU101 TaxID=1974212 RepID=UPI001A8CDBFE|nr:hypothetical protein [Chroococcus sp. FPU101]GFE70826.1 hypothetical protein CFPU101_34360 [Chroococcus sp. FPU101]